MTTKKIQLKNVDKVTRTDSDLGSVWVIPKIDLEAGTADIHLDNTDLERFRYPLLKLRRRTIIKV
jgi:hypothetical protein